MKSLKEEIEENVGNAYEIGHRHGRIDKSAIDLGWGKYSDKILELINKKVEQLKNYILMCKTERRKLVQKEDLQDCEYCDKCFMDKVNEVFGFDEKEGD